MVSRPLSPHLQVYKLPLPAILSITHRLTGLFLVAALWVALAGLICLTFFPHFYDQHCGCLRSCWGKGFLYTTLLCLYFHLLNGIRHLCWDAGYGFSLKATYGSAVVVLVGSVLLPLLTIFY